MKTCQRCKIEQELEQFTKKTNTCRTCFVAYNKEYYKHNKHRHIRTEDKKLKDKLRYKKDRVEILNKSKIQRHQDKLRDKVKQMYVTQYRRILNIPTRKDIEIYTSNEIWAKETEYLHFDLRFFPIFEKSV